MTLEIGARLGHYEIIAPLGRGGMGEVYRAHDERLGREVAIKVLPGHLVDDEAALARFRREARAVASLSHPNILAIHDVDLESETPFAVMELLKGRTLREELAERSMPRRKALKIAARIAAGLGAAHAAGILHRDLKPDNIFVTGDGRVKILDFGLAKEIVRPDDQSLTPTVDFETSPGTLMGTVGYMSPEQIRGQAIDHRSDLFSLGVVIYEMLSGKRAFARATAPETMTAILREEVDPIVCDPPLPPHLIRLLHRCLEKRPDQRFQSARDLAFDLESHGDTSTIQSQVVQGSPVSEKAGRWPRVAALLIVGTILGLVAGLRLAAPEPVSKATPVRLKTLTFVGRATNPAASPDGKMIAYSSQHEGNTRIWLKQLGGGSEAPLTEGPDDSPRFSADGETIFFSRFVDEVVSIYSTPLVGGSARKIVDDATRPAPSPDGTMLAFVRPGNRDVLLLSDIDGNDERILDTKEPGGTFLAPQWSPDGLRLAVAWSGGTNRVSVGELVIYTIADGGRKALTLDGSGSLSGATWLDDYSLVIAKATSLLGDLAETSSPVYRVDAATGESEILFWVDSIFPQGGSSTGFELLAPDTLVYHTRRSRQTLRIAEIDDDGPARDQSLTVGLSRDRQPTFAPDGERILFSSRRTGFLDLWEVDLETRALRQVTDDQAGDWDPAYSPDGEQIIWSSNRSGALEIWIADAGGTHARQVSKDGVDAENPTMTADGEWIVYSTGNSANIGLWKIHPDGSEATRLNECACILPELSPDGKLALYSEAILAGSTSILSVVAIENGEDVDFQIRHTAPVNARFRINLLRARWSPDGKHIAFMAHDDEGNTGIYMQDFVIGEDTTATRRAIAGLEPDFETESFGIAPDGRSIVFSALEIESVIQSAEGLALR